MYAHQIISNINCTIRNQSISVFLHLVFKSLLFNRIMQFLKVFSVHPYERFLGALLDQSTTHHLCHSWITWNHKTLPSLDRRDADLHDVKEGGRDWIQGTRRNQWHLKCMTSFCLPKLRVEDRSWSYWSASWSMLFNLSYYTSRQKKIKNLGTLWGLRDATFPLPFTMIHCIRLSNQLSHPKPIFVSNNLNL